MKYICEPRTIEKLEKYWNCETRSWISVGERFCSTHLVQIAECEEKDYGYTIMNLQLLITDESERIKNLEKEYQNKQISEEHFIRSIATRAEYISQFQSVIILLRKLTSSNAKTKTLYPC